MNPNAESYNRICDHWRDYRNGKPVDSCVAEFAKRLKPGAKVLDIGCGTGYPIAAHLSGIGCCVTGIDISERMIDCALGLNLPGAEFFVADLLQFRTDKRFDGVIAFDSIWHIPMEQQSQIYSLIGELIQTGQMNWPIPVLCALGVLLIAAGWILMTKKRKNDRA